MHFKDHKFKGQDIGVSDGIVNHFRRDTIFIKASKDKLQKISYKQFVYFPGKWHTLPLHFLERSDRTYAESFRFVVEIVLQAIFKALAKCLAFIYFGRTPIVAERKIADHVPIRI